MRLDVLLAAYEGERWLGAQLETLQAQTLRDFRVLMQDDGSLDATPQLLREMAARDSRFQLAHEQGGHLGAAGNYLSLLRQSDADYCALCDQDDLWKADKLEKQLARMQAAEKRYGRQTPLLVHSDCCLVDAEDRVLHESFFRHQGWNGKAVSLPELLVQNNVTGCTVLLNAPLRRLLAEHADENGVLMHDWTMALLAAGCGQIIFVPEALVRYRQHGRNAIGASEHGQVRRGLGMLRHWEQGQKRIALTYRNAKLFRRMFAPVLPVDAKKTVDAYLATEELPWSKRVLTVQKNGYRMQSPLTRLGQMLMG